MIGGLILLFAWLLTPAQQPSASFDCTRASHPLEKTICADSKLAKLDRDVAAAYREKLALMFDRTALRAQQRNWQQILRVRCKLACVAADVEQDYRIQLAFLRGLDTETWTANYKTPDIAELSITHLGPGSFDFRVERTVENGDGTKTLCKLPADDGEAGTIATILSLEQAKWNAGKCNVTFAFSRDSGGDVTAIAVETSPGCAEYCRGSNYRIDDNYLADNGWAASNQ